MTFMEKLSYKKTDLCDVDMVFRHLKTMSVLPFLKA